MKFRSIFIFAISLFSAINLLAQTPPVKTLVDMETKANGAGIRSNEAVEMVHYEIPLEIISKGKDLKLSPQLYNSMVVVKDGKKLVRWVINPEDTKWFKDVEMFMKSHNLEPIRHHHFKGYQTASRSYIVVDPTNGAQFSIKTSTNQTGGAWKDKKQDYKDGFDILLISDLMKKIQSQKPFEHTVIMQEPLVFGVESIDQSIVIRELADIATKEKFVYIPGFSVLHEETGKQIAKANGSSDPAAFWNEHYVKPMARSAAEVVARTGIWYDSPHGQNFLVELTKDLKPTGRMVLRDLGDIYINEQMMKALGENEVLKKFSTKENISTDLSVSFGPLHGNKVPSWVNDHVYKSWAKTFYKTFRADYFQRTGITVKEYNASHGFSYFGLSVDTGSKSFEDYNKILSAPKMCRSLFL